jgi:hypothetical protein
MSTFVNHEGIARGRERYGPKEIKNIVPSCVSCFCTQSMHNSSGKCKFCNLCQGWDPGTIKGPDPKPKGPGGV